MHHSFSPTGHLTLQAGPITLRQGAPVLNGAPLEGWQAEILPGAGRQTIRYTAPALQGGAFELSVEPDAEHRLWLRWALVGLPDSLTLDSFGLRFGQVENLRQYLKNGYTSWDASFYVEPEALAGFEPEAAFPDRGYAMTQLLPRHGQGSVVLGFDRHDRFQQTFTFDLTLQPPALTILTLWDRKDRRNLKRCESERLVVFEHPGVEDALRSWAQIVASAAPQPPRPGIPPITGWCSWYNLYAYIDEASILHHLRAAAETRDRLGLPLRVFQIDDGFTPEMGDWLDVKPQFPRGIPPLLDDIRRAGFIPGLWIAPFLVGNRSRLFAEHPDWVVHDRETGGPLAHWKLYAEFRWHKRSEEYYILDVTHPEAFAYLRHVFHTWSHDWGCEYFKTDFMHFGSEHGPDRAVWHTPGLTRIEIWRRLTEMIRQEIGDALWLGCGCPLWASVGLVDGIRIGSDVGVEWRGGLSAASLLRDAPTRNFGHGLLWQADPDCILLRTRFHHLTDVEVRSLALYAGLLGGVRMTSDDLGELSPERLRLFDLILRAGAAPCRFPLLGQTPIVYERLPADLHSHRVRPAPRPADPVIVQVRDGAGPSPVHAVHIFNTGDHPAQRTYPLALLGLSSPRHVYDWTAGAAWDAPVDRLSLRLDPHESALLFLSAEPITDAPEVLP